MQFPEVNSLFQAHGFYLVIPRTDQNMKTRKKNPARRKTLPEGHVSDVHAKMSCFCFYQLDLVYELERRYMMVDCALSLNVLSFKPA